MQGISGMNTKGAAALNAGAPAQAPEPLETGGGVGGMLNQQKDAKEAQTEAQFGDLWKQIQTRYGSRPDKPREIKKALGKDDFLRIMITQMKNQDPTSPFKAEEMATQMAQFASVEQLQNLNQSMGKMANNHQPLERLAMTNLIGKTVTIDRERFVHNENEASTLGYGLERDAKSVKLKIMSEAGETVLEKDLGAQKAGDQKFAWDGAKTSGMAVKSGNFIFKVEAEDGSGKPIVMNTKGQSKVVGVAFEGPEGVLLVGDANSPQKVTMRNVIRIDSNGEPSAIPGARSMAQALQSQGLGASAGAMASEGTEASPQGTVPGTPAKKSGLNGNWASFEPGVGSRNLDGAANAEARKALEAYEAAKATDGNSLSTENNEKSAEKGFPSGLSSGDT